MIWLLSGVKDGENEAEGEGVCVNLLVVSKMYVAVNEFGVTDEGPGVFVKERLGV